MTTKQRLMAYLNAIGFDHIFSTRDVLLFGKRQTIDSILSRLVKEGVLERLAAGVFRKSTGTARPYSVIEIALVKARAFGRKIYTDSTAIGKRLSEGNDDRFVFATDGRTTSFKVGDVRVYFRGTAKRKLALSKNEVGRSLQYAWHCRSSQVLKRVMEKLQTALPTAALRDQLVHHASRIPEWISSWLHRNLEPEKLMPAPVHVALSTSILTVPTELFLRERASPYELRIRVS